MKISWEDYCLIMGVNPDVLTLEQMDAWQKRWRECCQENPPIESRIELTPIEEEE